MIERVAREISSGGTGDPNQSLKAVDDSGRTREVDTGRFAEPEEAAEAEVGVSVDEGTETVTEELEVPAEGAEEEGQGEAESFSIELPPRAEGQDPVTIEVASQQEADQLRMVTNGFMRRTEYNRQMEQVQNDQADLTNVEAALREDPAEFVLSRTPPELQVQLAVQVLATLSEDQLNPVIDQLAQWERNPQARQIEAVRRENERLKKQWDAEQTRTQQTQFQGAASKISVAVQALIPEEMQQGKADRFYGTAIRLLQDHLRSSNLTSFTPEQVRPLLEASGVLDDYGINGKTPSQPAGRQGAQTEKPTTPKRAEQRRAARSVAPAGLGSGSANVHAPPEGQTLRERLDWAKARLNR